MNMRKLFVQCKLLLKPVGYYAVSAYNVGWRGQICPDLYTILNKATIAL